MPILTRLKITREAALMTQTELAKRSGLAQPTISYLEQGRPAQIRSIRKLAKALKVTPDELLGPLPVSENPAQDADTVMTNPPQEAALTEPDPIPPEPRPRRSIGAAPSVMPGLALAIETAERYRVADNLAEAERWEKIAADIAARTAQEAQR